MTRLRDLQGGVTKLRYASDISRSTSSMCVGVTGRSLCDRARVPSSVGFLELISPWWKIVLVTIRLAGIVCNNGICNELPNSPPLSLCLVNFLRL